ncbi:ABC transporter ATP-binding protein [Hyphomicrobium sp.]|uniref:ABC transporter ATP-binding protein n=1 Tax=Hyphomicrobium sp. TaxID=82 RepID=UPI000F9C4A72|nr:ABC transporter ATP-binding protein [Hyphomicrobium sp.]RUO99509.1 MAG: ABC transporter ATP-binding protein [Hyphomicrobium sp.]
MLRRLMSWGETRIKPFDERAVVRPPDTLWAFYWFFIKPLWPFFLLLLIAGCLGSTIEVALMGFIGAIVDRMRTHGDPSTFLSTYGWMLTGMAFVALVIRPLVSAAHDFIKNQMLSPGCTSRVRWQTHRYVLRQSLGFFQNDFAGRVANKIMQTGASLRESVVQLIDALWYASVQFVGSALLFAASDWRLTIPLLIWLVAYTVALRYFVPRIKERSTEASEARSMLVGRIVDSYTNIMTVKLFAHTEREDTYAREALTEQMQKWQVSLRLITGMEITLYLLNGLLLVATTGLAIWLWTMHHVSVGDIAVVGGLVIRIVTMSGWVMWTIADVFENIGVVHEGMETISRPNLLVDVPDAKPLTVPRGEIKFDHIHFHYGAGRAASDDVPPRVIESLSLTVRPGEKVGLVGRSGAGKSTLVNLLLRFYDLEGGRILIDGRDIAHVTQDSLRAEIGLVTQDTSLLHRSVRDNILYGRLNATEAEVIAAAKQAEAHEFIMNLEDLKGRKGYDAHVGERGVKLSGGQRQRIAIARVLLKNAPILVLDEATSALDSEVESAIQTSFETLMRGKTVIAIAHRLSTIAAMDRLVVMEDGRIVEEGTHAELLKRGGIYAQLWLRQSGGFLAREAAE